MTLLLAGTYDPLGLAAGRFEWNGGRVGDGAPIAAIAWNGQRALSGGGYGCPGVQAPPVEILARRFWRPHQAVAPLFHPAQTVLPRALKGAAVADWKTLEAQLPFKFKDRELLRQALIHTSYLNENPGIGVGSNERLEFLGDAALGVVVADQLYREYPDVDEGTLTELRAHLVRRDTLARAASRLDLGDFIQLGRGEDAAGGRRRPTNLARAYEALVGAIFLDGGIVRVRSFVKRSLAPELEALRERGMPHDPKSQLQEIIQSKFQTTPSYKLLKTEGPDHARRFTVQVVVAGKPLGVGEGRSKQLAEKEAAQVTLQQLEEEQESA